MRKIKQIIHYWNSMKSMLITFNNGIYWKEMCHELTTLDRRITNKTVIAAVLFILKSSVLRIAIQLKAFKS